jgi:DNA-binding NtrC family response regulator
MTPANLERGPSLPNLVGTSAAMRALKRDLRRLAPLPTTILVTGETGTGKSEVARALHHASPRVGAPFVQVDCASLAPSLVESELFGHEAGAFTGARALHRGRLERAGAGTLFLDEVGELSPALQTRLLRVLQERTFERVGGTRPLRFAARVVAATHVDLESAVRTGRFRADLYYRLHVARLHVPPLRKRVEDIPLLVEHALARMGARLGLPLCQPPEGFLERLAQHPWQGNVRELLNVIEVLLVRSEGGRLSTAALDELLGRAPLLRPGADGGAWLARDRPSAPEADHPERIAAALRATGGNVARAARRLGVARSTLRHRIARYGLTELIPRD